MSRSCGSAKSSSDVCTSTTSSATGRTALQTACRDARLANTRDLQTQLFNQLSRWTILRILENASGAFRDWLRCAALLLRCVQFSRNLFGRGRLAAKDGGHGKIVFKQRKASIMYFQFVSRFRVRISFRVEITDTDNVLKSLCAHGTSVHPQTAADSAGNALHPLQATNPGCLTSIGDLF